MSDSVHSAQHEPLIACPHNTSAGRTPATVAAAPDRTAPRDAALPLLIGLGVFLAQALWVSAYTPDFLFWDEWDLAEYFKRALDGPLSFEALFALHNEHRIVTTRLLSLATFAALGNVYYPIANMLVSALVNGALAGLWAWTTARLVGRNWLTALSCLLLVSPVQFENILWGFQIPFYTLMLGSIGGACGLALIGRLRWRAVAVALAGMGMATFSMASGVAACIALPLGLLLLGWRDAGGGRMLLRNRRALLKVGVGALGGALILTLFFWGYPFLGQTQTRDWGMVAAYWWTALAYPVTALRDAAWPVKAIGAALIWGPVVGACALLVVGRGDHRTLTLLIVAAVAVVGITGTIAVGRWFVIFVSPRYTTILLWSSLLSMLGLAVMARRSAAVRNVALRRALLAMCNGVGVVLLVIHTAQAFDALSGSMSDYLAWRRQMAMNVSRFVHGVTTTLEDPAPYPDREVLIGHLTDPVTLSILPFEYRPQRLEPVAVVGDAWTVNGEYPFLRAGQEGPPVRWGSWSGAAERTGVLWSAPFVVRERYLVVPIAGYPHRDGTRLAIEEVEGSGRSIAYLGDNPGEAWGRWVVDLRGMEGRTVQLVAVDEATDHGGWLGVGALYFQNAQMMLLQRVLDLLPLIAVGVLLVAVAVTFPVGLGRNGR